MKNFTARNSAFPNDPYNLQRFLDAQEPVFEDVCRESRRRQETYALDVVHFSPSQGLGSEPDGEKASHFFSRRSKGYLEHSILGPRLRECARLVSAVNGHSIGRSIEDIFEYPDYMKFRSSMTLFAQAAPDNEVFNNCLRKYFNGKPDPETLAHLNEANGRSSIPTKATITSAHPYILFYSVCLLPHVLPL